VTGAVVSAVFRDEDFEPVFALYRAAMGAHVARAFGWDEAFQRENLLRSLRSPGARVARDAGRVVAFSVTRPKGAACEIFLLCVDAAFRRRGLGQRMIAQIDRDAGEADALVGSILPGNDVAGFYARLGFAIHPREDGGAHIERARVRPPDALGRSRFD
jgi:ribosomal protein S18 acetylase RimI-like enzyme